AQLRERASQALWREHDVFRSARGARHRVAYQARNPGDLSRIARLAHFRGPGRPGDCGSGTPPRDHRPRRQHLGDGAVLQAVCAGGGCFRAGGHQIHRRSLRRHARCDHLYEGSLAEAQALDPRARADGGSGRRLSRSAGPAYARGAPETALEGGGRGRRVDRSPARGRARAPPGAPRRSGTRDLEARFYRRLRPLRRGAEGGRHRACALRDDRRPGALRNRLVLGRVREPDRALRSTRDAQCDQVAAQGAVLPDPRRTGERRRPDRGPRDGIRTPSLYLTQSSARTSFAPSTIAFSFSNATSRGMYFIPQSGATTRFSGATNGRARRMRAATFCGVSTVMSFKSITPRTIVLPGRDFSTEQSRLDCAVSIE